MRLLLLDIPDDEIHLMTRDQLVTVKNIGNGSQEPPLYELPDPDRLDKILKGWILE